MVDLLALFSVIFKSRNALKQRLRRQSPGRRTGLVLAGLDPAHIAGFGLAFHSETA